MFKSLGLLLFLGFVSATWSVAPNCPDNPENPSESDTCQLPNCRCFSTVPPKSREVPKNGRPQIVYLTFDDAINVLNYEFYQEVLFGRLNPNGASISATFFINHEYNDYNKTNDLYRRGHDIALHSITHQNDPNYWATLPEVHWEREFRDQREMIARFANIPLAAIKGVRAPSFQVGGDRMYRVLNQHYAFEWESSRPTWRFRPLLWPYTADYYSFQDCAVGECPTESYPGFWTVPMVDFLGGDLYPCAMVDTCLPTVSTTQETFNLLKTNFDDHYEGQGTKAPFGVFTHAAWVNNPERKQGYINFLDYIQSKPDVYIVSISKALDYIKNPVNITNIDEILSWNPAPIIENNCLRPANCRFSGSQTPHAGGAERYMMNCQPCASIRNYPWLGNPLGI